MAVPPDHPDHPPTSGAAAPDPVAAPVTDAGAVAAEPTAPDPAAPAPAAPAPARTFGSGHKRRGRPVPRTRTGTAWAGIIAAVVLLILLIVFIAQNAHPVDVSFLMLHGRFPLAVALLAAVAGGALITVVIGSLRMLQLRRAVPRRSRVAAPPAAAAPPVPEKKEQSQA
ncbi:lipopolysaccharide assembly protein LapA domain-containing protein [Streptacidiphilus cavernicola]|uniref:Lipopolysaccharide assembly protein LapA domain-containing protein n=1 Tax=Streptacidiphilus cavernicola TaxID=3342716 RepID=A0ABV6W657_9ACTN